MRERTISVCQRGSCIRRPKNKYAALTAEPSGFSAAGSGFDGAEDTPHREFLLRRFAAGAACFLKTAQPVRNARQSGAACEDVRRLVLFSGAGQKRCGRNKRNKSSVHRRRQSENRLLVQS